MQIGDYVRTKNGYIGRITSIDNEMNKVYYYTEKQTSSVPIQDIIKYVENKKDIIGLIEVGDYVNGEKVIALRDEIEERNIHFNSKDNLIFTDYDIANKWYFGIDTDRIKSIVTKELFERMEYRIWLQRKK